MGRLGFAITMGLMLAGTAASAQGTGGPAIVSLQTSAGSQIVPGTQCLDCTNFGGGPTNVGYGAGAATFPDNTYPSTASGKAKWNSFVTNNTDDGTITFESSNTTSGQPIGSISTSTVVLGIQNGAGLNLHSTITPAGMGFYVADTGDGSCILTGTCSQVAPGSNYDFAAFAAASNNFGAFAGFDFSVTASADGHDDLLLYNVSASLQLSRDGVLIVSQDLTDGFTKLSHFGLDTPPAGGPIPYHSYGYNWAETGFNAGSLQEAYYQTVTYRTSVFSYVNAPCLNNGTVCLLAYSGFGDPIGRGVSELSVNDIGALNHGADDLITGLNFSPFTITAPRINGGTLEVGGSATPEPGAWAMMILGFASIGGVLRRRRELAHA